MKAILIDAKDNVAVVLGAVKKGDTISFVRGTAACEITAPGDVPVYHKIASAFIPQGQPVVKYGEHIGLAAADIQPGSHVHVHNVLSKRESL